MFYIILFIILSVAFIASESSSGYYDRGTSNPLLSVLAALFWTFIVWGAIKFIKWATRAERRHQREVWGPLLNQKQEATTTVRRIETNKNNTKSSKGKTKAKITNSHSDYDRDDDD